MMPAIAAHIAEYPLQWRNERRIAFLHGCIEELTAVVVHERVLHQDYVQRNRLIEILITTERIQALRTEIAKHKKEIGRLVTPNDDRNHITDDMIRRAKEYPFEQLHEFKRGMGLCPFHADKHPSMSLKNNRVRCWSCMDKSMDTIDFIMMRDNKTFSEAVKRLQ